MSHKDYVFLLKKAIPTKKAEWADLGSGDGAFTLAVRDLGGPEIEIYSVEKDTQRLHVQRQDFVIMFPGTKIQFLEQDFNDFLNLPFLDGILMANSFHFVENQTEFLRKMKGYLKPGGKFVLVEYNIDTPNEYVPHPVSFNTFKAMCAEVGMENPELLEKVPASLGDMYSAQAFA